MNDKWEMMNKDLMMNDEWWIMQSEQSRVRVAVRVSVRESDVRECVRKTAYLPTVSYLLPTASCHLHPANCSLLTNSLHFQLILWFQL